MEEIPCALDKGWDVAATYGRKYLLSSQGMTKCLMNRAHGKSTSTDVVELV